MANPRLNNPRWHALKAIMKVVGPGRALDDALRATLDSAGNMDRRDIALCRALAYGVCRWFYALRLVSVDYLKKPFKQKDSDLEVILFLGLYQIIMMKVEPHAAVNESVKLVQQQNKDWAKGLVNAVLRNVVRNQVTMTEADEHSSYPKWFREKLHEDWQDQYHSVLVAGNRQAPMCLRVDTSQLSVNECIQSLHEHSIDAMPHDLIDSAVVLDKPCDVETLPGFTSGLVSVQDPAAQLAANLLDCKPDMRVLDACAAPGGKSIHLLQRTKSLQLIALDQDASRLELIRQNLTRTGLSARIICADASSPEDWFNGDRFDRILADVPCSASGVIRRHPDIKLLRRASDIEKLVSLQRDIIDALWPLLKPGGMMVYSTCSIFKDENERQIGWFVQSHENAKVIELKSVQWGEQRPGGRQILPGSHDMDGFFYACLKKIA